MPAIWTDANDKVQRLHHQPANVDTSGATVVDTQPPAKSVEDWQSAVLHYNGVDGYYHEVRDPWSDWNITNADKQALFDAMEHNDMDGLQSAVQNL